MQLVLHAGAHFTEEERMMKCLLRNKAAFASRGVAVPGPGKYRTLLRDTLNALQDAPQSGDAREVLLDAILDDEAADRVLLSNAHFFSPPRLALRHGLLYPAAAERLRGLRTLFPHDQIELFLALRNPASFLPAVFGKSKKDGVEDFMNGVDPLDVRWSDTIARLRDAVPDVAITLWCSEDAPMVWAAVIREMAGLEHGEKITGGFDLLTKIMSPEGMKRFRAYLKDHPVMSEMQKRRVIAAFLDKFALDDEVEEELDMPGWSDSLVQEMTEAYDEDVFAIRRLTDVQIIAP